MAAHLGAYCHFLGDQTMKTQRKVLGAAALIALAATAAPAQAAVLTAGDIFTEFNAVVWNDFTTTSDVEGRLAANNITGGATFYNNPRGDASAFRAINAINISNTNGNVNNGGSVNYQSSITNSHFNYNGGGSLVQTPSFAISDFTKPLNAEIATLSGLTQNSAVNSSDNNNVNFQVAPDAKGIAVFDITGAQFASYAGVKFSNVTSAKTIIVNVTGGGAITQNFNYVDSTALYENNHVIWNFEGATGLSIKTIHGAVLAQDATVTNGSPIEGLLYAENFNGNGELHDYPFLGALPTSAVPEPSTWALMGLGFAGLGFASRRARKSAAAA
jgi:choice-of-anchor A domain-containing protein